MAIRLQRVDASNIDDHSQLSLQDECYYLFEYTSGKDYSFSKTNSLISNLKKKPSTAGSPGYLYKHRAMAECVQHLAPAINPKWLQGAVLVPVPPSKVRGHPDFDDRMTKICRRIPNSDVRELIVQAQSLTAAHETSTRPTVADLLALYSIDRSLLTPPPARIGVVDDVLTAGTHYRAMHTLLTAQFPNVPIVGFFIARRVFPPPDFDEVLAVDL